MCGFIATLAYSAIFSSCSHMIITLLKLTSSIFQTLFSKGTNGTMFHFEV